MSKLLWISPELALDLSEIWYTYARSSGPGGQNVNKVNSKAVLHWCLEESASVSEPVRMRLREKLRTRINEDGVLVLMSDRFRDQPMNRADVLEKFATLLSEAVRVPKQRKKTKPSRSAKKRATEKKRIHSEKKKLRHRVERS